jgi:FAD/FMN-containing dehydrogenase
MSRRITRRQALKQAAAIVFAPAIVRPWRALGAALPAPPNLPPSEARFLHPGDSDFDKYERVYNRRTLVSPQLDALCKTPNAVAVMVAWARSNQVPFAVRSGGHSYEGLSESPSVVINTREINGIQISGQSVTVGAGASLGAIYKKIGDKNFAIPAGSCPSVGVAGHVLGGGFGLLGRPFGLACDSLEWIELVDPQGRLVAADAQSNPDLFWACRGGGGGSFGAATRFRFKLHRVSQVVTFGIDWLFAAADVDRAVKVVQAWQGWAPNAPRDITSILRFGKHDANGRINVHCSGQSVGSAQKLTRELNLLLGTAKPASGPNIKPRSFLDAVKLFSGDPQYRLNFVPTYESIYMKGKSDYVASPLGGDTIRMFMEKLLQLPAGAIVPICDAYGGAVADVAADATAFAHRAGMLYCIQYYSQWDNASNTQERLGFMADLYASLRPYMSGAAYANYCDLELGDGYADAYWGANLPRLRQIKSAFDPDNVFQHRQSVRPAP